MNKDKVNRELKRLFKLADSQHFRKLSEKETDLLFLYRDLFRSIDEKYSLFMRLYGEKWTEIKEFQKLSKLEKVIKEKVGEILNESSRFTNKTLVEAFKESQKITVEVFKETTGIEFSFRKPDAATIREIIKNPFDRVKWKWKGRLVNHHNAAIEEIKSVIVKGLREGTGYAKTAAEIVNKVDKLANNAIRIVRTESHRSQILGRDQAIMNAQKSAKKLGIEVQKVIVAVKDSRTRDQSISMDGQVAGEDGLFTYPNGTKGLPGNTGIPEYDINDREIVIIQLQ